MSALDVPIFEWEEGGNRLEGCYENLSNEEYHSSWALSSTKAKRLLQSPAHSLVPIKRTPAMEDGSALHALVLEPERDLVPIMPEKYALPERPEDANGKAKKDSPEKKMFLDWKKECASREVAQEYWRAALDPEAILLDGARLHNVQSMAQSVLNNEGLKRGGLLDGLKEASFFATDKKTGAYVRAKLDIWNPDTRIICDVKKCKDASERGFRSAVAEYGYHLSAAMYIEVLEMLGHQVDHFYFICVDAYAPHAVAVYELCDNSLDQGRREWRKAAKLWLGCKKSGVWPGYSTGITTLTLPGWKRDDLFDT
jgi:hypothetical protein